MSYTPLTLLVEVSKRLEERGILYAVAGALAANVYRTSSRQTGDVDFAIVADGKTEEIARSLIEEFGFSASSLRKADLDGGPRFAIEKKSTPFQAVIGRIPGKPEETGLDILLPDIPWVPDAVKRAQAHKVEFLKGVRLPVITIEDLIISKLLAYQSRKTRGKDIDDLKDILSASRELDNAYLTAQISAHKIVVPKFLQQNLHFSVLRAVRKIKAR